MSYKRRTFLKDTSVTISGLALFGISSSLHACEGKRHAIPSFGVQLYSVRDLMPGDPMGTLEQIAGFGYSQIESYEHDRLGMFWGMTNTEFKDRADKLGLQVLSSHCDITNDFERKAIEASEIGMKYLICPWIGPQSSLEDYKKAAQRFNECGAICRKHGIGFAYHNHDYSFTELNGSFPQDILMQETDKALVDFEMDIYWVVTAGQDPIQWLAKYPERFKLLHLKDRQQGAPLTNKEASVVLGTGSIDYPGIIKRNAVNGYPHLIVEQEHYSGTSPLKAAKENAGYLRSLLSQ